MKFLVVPSNREQSLYAFLAKWRGKGGWDKIIVVEDGPEKSFKLQSEADYHYSWAEIKTILGNDAWIISKCDSAIRCFGFLAAYHLGAEHVLTLDDDCYPAHIWHEQHIFDAHLSRFTIHPKWVESIKGQRTRGIPYLTDTVPLKSIVANVGLWENCGDWDSVQERPKGYFIPPQGSRIIPSGQYFPVCGMNLCIARKALPLFYFPLMGDGQTYRRFDDIWAGVIAKKLMDARGWNISVGEPFVEHIRASDPEVNRVKEAPGIAANEWFWKVIDGARIQQGGTAAIIELGNYLQESDFKDEIDKPYIKQLGKALKVWAGLFALFFQGRFRDGL